MLRTWLAPLVLVLALGASACADEEGSGEGTPTPTSTPTATATSSSESPSEEPTSEPTPEAQVIEVTFEGDTVTPNGERIEVPLGEEVVLEVTADAPGEIHVHSTPEHSIAYKAGTSSHPLTFDQPGVVEVESHDLHLVIAQLEVR